MEQEPAAEDSANISHLREHSSGGKIVSPCVGEGSHTPGREQKGREQFHTPELTGTSEETQLWICRLSDIAYHG